MSCSGSALRAGQGAAMSEFLRKRLYALYAAYAAGKIADVLGAFDDKVEFTSYAPVDVFPYLGRKQGKAAVEATMNAAHAEFEYLSYQPVFMVVQGEDAAVIVLARLRQRVTGRIIQLFVADFIRFAQGRIVELREFMDSYDAVQQVLGREFHLHKS
jgi:ketosteroid isomerase-like protein